MMGSLLDRPCTLEVKKMELVVHIVGVVILPQNVM